MKSQLLYYRLIILFIVLQTPVFYSCKKERTAVKTIDNKEKAVYEVINYCLSNRDLIGLEPILMDRLKNLPIHDIDIIEDNSLFTQKDINYLRGQVHDTIALKIKGTKILKRHCLISADSLYASLAKHRNSEGSDKFWEEYYKVYPKGFYSISKPLFSANHKTAIIAVSYHCGGLCGSGETYILRKDENGWYVFKTVSSWIS